MSKSWHFKDMVVFREFPFGLIQLCVLMVVKPSSFKILLSRIFALPPQDQVTALSSYKPGQGACFCATLSQLRRVLWLPLHSHGPWDSPVWYWGFYTYKHIKCILYISFGDLLKGERFFIHVKCRVILEMRLPLETYIHIQYIIKNWEMG